MSPYESIAQSRLEDTDNLDLAGVMLDHYGQDVLQVTLHILPKIPCQDLRDDLENKMSQDPPFPLHKSSGAETGEGKCAFNKLLACRLVHFCLRVFDSLHLSCHVSWSGTDQRESQ